MGLHKLSAGDGYTYLTRQVAAHDATETGYASLEEYYSERGESPGRWHGSGLAGLGITADTVVTETQMKSLFGEGRHPDAARLEAAAAASGADARTITRVGALGRAFNVYAGAPTFTTEVARAFTQHNLDASRPWNTPIDPEVRARIRTEVATRLFTTRHERAPHDARELAGFVAVGSRSRTSAVAGYDLTFSPVKSVSTLWALAPAPIAAQVRAAHDAAVADTVRWLEQEACFTRLGHAGARQVPTHGLIATSFTHRDTRAGDPDLHTHLAISNKVQASVRGPERGKWFALDGRLLYQANVAASERYNTRLEAELVDRLGVQFTDSPTDGAKRPVRELVGMNTLLTGWWSRRRRDIDHRRAQLATDFQHDHGRPPTTIEAIALAQRATLETRTAKHAPRSEHDQRATWRTEAEHVLGGPGEVDHLLTRVLHPQTSPPAFTPDLEWCARTATQVTAAVEGARATWTVWHLRAEAERHARAARVPLLMLPATVDQVVHDALDRSVRLGLPDPTVEPPALRRPDGTSVYAVHGATRYTSARILHAEQQILAATRTTGTHRVPPHLVAAAIEATENGGMVLNDAQAALVRELATSGRAVQLALAPAGTGKTTAMRTLSDAWTRSGGTVLGLAPSAQAAHELRAALADSSCEERTSTERVAVHTDTLTKLTWTLTHTPAAQWPTWVQEIGPGTLLVIDEAGQAATTDLALTIDHATRCGASVRLIGDDEQLAAVAAGGVLRDIQRTAGAVTLTEIRRFTDPAEAAATLALRGGDATALAFYADNDRIHIGDLGSATDQAYTAWAADRAAGLNTLLLAPTRDLVTQLNTRARSDRLAGMSAPAATSVTHSAEVRLVDGNHASIGDTIITKRNDRTLPLTDTDWVKNGDRWTVTDVHPDQSITATHHGIRRTLRLPATYVEDHVLLGYATTVHAAQGTTTDTTHAVLTGEESRQVLYVAATRGRDANHLYLATGTTGDPHTLVRPETLRPATPLETLADIVDRDGAQESATTTQHDAAAPATQLREAVLRYRDALQYAADTTLDTRHRDRLTQRLETTCPGITEDPGYLALRDHLTLRTLDDPAVLDRLLQTATSLDLAHADDRAAVLDWRLTHETPPADMTSAPPLPWLDPTPTRLADDPVWGPYLGTRAARVVGLADAVRSDADAWTAVSCPPWARELIDPACIDLRGDLAVWRAATDAADDDRPSGRRAVGSSMRAHQRSLDRRVRQALHQEADKTVRREAIRTHLPEAVQEDPRSHNLVRRLARLGRAGPDVGALVTAALAAPAPLPVDCAADALWWRIQRHLGPATVTASRSDAQTLAPTWWPDLVQLLGAHTADRVRDDHAWPALVAAVAHRPDDWTCAQLLSAVVTGPTTPDAELCEALVWRIAIMTDPPTETTDNLDPPAPHDPGPQTLEAPAAAPNPPAGGATSTARILELNAQAHQVFSDLYLDSWAPDYVAHRLGQDVASDGRFAVGYAPVGPRHLLKRLTHAGATARELLDAGLIRRRDDGTVVDVYRDRLMFPIRTERGIAGFVGRRNPAHEDRPYAGPKYLNTRSTPAFHKAEVLFGLEEGRTSLEAGATPVLVEGPLDAITVSLCAPGFVGVAALGTAITAGHTRLLRPYLEPAREIIIATDADPAGWKAGEHAFWELHALGAVPRRLDLPPGCDPAEASTQHGQLTRGLLSAAPFTGGLLDHLVDVTDLGDTAARIWFARRAAPIIQATPVSDWLPLIRRTQARAQIPPGVLEAEMLPLIGRVDPGRPEPHRTLTSPNPSRDQQRRISRQRTGTFPAQRPESERLGARKPQGDVSVSGRQPSHEVSHYGSHSGHRGIG